MEATNRQTWRILLVDDDEDDYLLTRDMLAQTRGSQVHLTWAPDPDAGRKALERHTFDAVLMDYDLGACSGLELTREAVTEGYPAPIILLTGRGSYEVDLEAMEAGASLYLTKSEINPLLLERSIRYAIERKHIERALRFAHSGLEARVQERTQELARSNAELAEAKAGLERRVAERTAELQRVNARLGAANARLRAELAERKRAESALARLEWLLSKNLPESLPQDEGSATASALDGSLAELNTSRLLLDTVGDDVLKDVVSDFLDLLETSAAVYEKNGDYALDLFSSGWCRYMNAASRDLCQTSDNRQALDSGKWLCHESCWNQASHPAIETGQPTDIACNGGMRIYALPIFANGEVVGSINFGYGDPPRDPEKLQELAGLYQVPVEKLQELAAAYETRPPYLIELARRRLLVSARLLGALVERKQAERLLADANAALSAANARLQERTQELEQFTLAASHDLQEPLRKVEAFTNRLLVEPSQNLTGQQRDYLERIGSAAGRMRTMLSGLLALSRVTTRGRPFGRVDLAQTATGVVSDLEVLIHKTGGQVELGDLPVIAGDGIQMRQLFQNLIGNALKFHKPGEPPRVRVYTRPATLPNGGMVVPPNTAQFVEIVVSDNGIGFDPDQAERIFQPFHRLVDRDDYEGTGIGLALCRKIVERHGGSITALSSPGQGASFVATLLLEPPAGVSYS